MENGQRSIEEKLKDAHKALRAARADLGRAINQRDQATNHVATRRVKIDQLEAWAAMLQAQWDAQQPVIENVIEEFGLDPKSGEERGDAGSQD